MDGDNFKILAYFSLALKSLKLGVSVSRTIVKRIDGLAKDTREVPVYLLGQLGKNDPYSDLISGNEILEPYVFPLVAESARLVGGRTLLVECYNRPWLFSVPHIKTATTHTRPHTYKDLLLLANLLSMPDKEWFGATRGFLLRQRRRVGAGAFSRKEGVSRVSGGDTPEGEEWRDGSAWRDEAAAA